jgi:hypothetical protein
MAALRVVHFSASRLAGVPIRQVQALRAHTEHDARLVDVRRWGQFDHDVVFSESPEAAIELVKQADVIHLYNHLDYDSREFAPIDFAALRAEGKLFVRQFNSAPVTVARRMGHDMARVLDSPVPSLVAAQCWERLYPKARLVPLLLPQDDAAYRPSGEPGSGVIFTPGAPGTAWERRWGLKGHRETIALLRRVARRTGCETEVIDDARPVSRVLSAKRDRLVVIDELVTGSFHQNGLEGLCLGRAALAYLDDRVQYVLREFSGSATNPFVSVQLEDAEDVLVYLVEHPDEAAEIGLAGRGWVERHWSDRLLVRHFVDVYETLAAGGEIRRQPEFALDGASTRLSGIVVPDLVWAARRRRALAARPLAAKVATRAGEAYRGLPWPVRKRVRTLLRRPIGDEEDVAGLRVDRRVYEQEIRSLGTSPSGSAPAESPPRSRAHSARAAAPSASRRES